MDSMLTRRAPARDDGVGVGMKQIPASLCIVVMAIFALTGCAATHTAVQITKANQAVKRAKDRGAAQYAVYEYTMAEHYLNKAREEAGASDFKDSVQLAHGAAEWADKAIIAIEKEGRDLDESALPGETRTLTEEDRLGTASDEPSTKEMPTPLETPSTPENTETSEAEDNTETPEAQEDTKTPSDTKVSPAETEKPSPNADNRSIEEVPQ